MSGYLWYSNASKETGILLAEALKFTHGRKTPLFDRYDVVVGWGCKPGTAYRADALSKLIRDRRVRILNHVDRIKSSKNRIHTLKEWKAAGIPTPGFTEFDPRARPLATISSAVKGGALGYPMILQDPFSKNKPAICYTKEDCTAALVASAQKEHPFTYARTLDQGEEFRVHIFRDTALFVQQKTLTADPVTTASAALMKKAEKSLGKGAEFSVNERKLVASVITELAAEFIQSSNHLRKSASTGWQFCDIPLEKAPLDAVVIATNAVEAAALDMGAVGVSFVDGVYRALSITTGPVLTEEQVSKYAEEISEFAEAAPLRTDVVEKPKEAKKLAAAKKENIPAELSRRVLEKVRSLSPAKTRALLAFMGDEEGGS